MVDTVAVSPVHASCDASSNWAIFCFNDDNEMLFLLAPSDKKAAFSPLRKHCHIFLAEKHPLVLTARCFRFNLSLN